MVSSLCFGVPEWLVKVVQAMHVGVRSRTLVSSSFNKGVPKNSIFCSGCSFWVHKKCSNNPGRLVKDPNFRCGRCLGNARAIDRRPCVEV